MLGNPLHEEILPNIQSKTPLVQLEAISSFLVSYYLGEKIDPHLATAPFLATWANLAHVLMLLTSVPHT